MDSGICQTSSAPPAEPGGLLRCARPRHWRYISDGTISAASTGPCASHQQWKPGLQIISGRLEYFWAQHKIKALPDKTPP